MRAPRQRQQRYACCGGKKRKVMGRVRVRWMDRWWWIGSEGRRRASEHHTRALRAGRADDAATACRRELSKG